MARTPLALSALLDAVDDPQAMADLTSYFSQTVKSDGVPPYTGSSFEFFAAAATTRRSRTG